MNTPLFFLSSVLLTVSFYSMQNNAMLCQAPKDKKKDLPLHWLVESQNINKLRICLEEMRSKGAADKYFYPRGEKLQTPLHKGVILNNLEIVKLLFEYPISINAKDEDGATPLFYALGHKDHAVLIYLLKIQGASPRVSNKIGWAPVHVAVYFQDLDALKLLKKYGADFRDLAQDNFMNNLDLSLEDDSASEDDLSFEDDFTPYLGFSPIALYELLNVFRDKNGKIREKISKYLKRNLKKKPRKMKKMKILSASADGINLEYIPLCVREPQAQVKSREFEDLDTYELQRVPTSYHLPKPKPARKMSDPVMHLISSTGR